MGTLFLNAQNKNLTLKVDMRDYTGPSYTTVHVNGTWNNWCGTCNPLSDVDNDSIWEVTLPIPAGTYEYLFTLDGWTTAEALAPGLPCTKTTGANTNREVPLVNDTIMPVVCWESCSMCTGAPASAMVTFSVDMSNYSGSFTNVNLNGTFNSWCGGCAVMLDPDMDNIYELSISVPTSDTIDFKYTLDGWTAEESLTPGSSCTRTVTDMSGTFTNRSFVPSKDTVLSPVCWESCSACTFVSIEENWVNEFNISPNPSNGIINIEATFNNTEDYTIMVLDLQGRAIFESSNTGNNISETIDLSFADNGMYILNIIGNESVLSNRIMITE